MKKLNLFIGLLTVIVFAAITSAKRIETSKTIFNPVIGPGIPADVSVPLGFPDNPISFFDDYSWRIFIALVWPAKTGQRGTADSNLTIGSQSPVVFETFKSDWEIFHPAGSSPSADWNGFGDPLPCAIPETFGFADIALVAISKFGNLGQAGVGSLVGPIVSQNGRYVRYLTGFNQTEFNKIISDKLYLQSNLNNVSFPDGAIDVKSSWIEMKSIQHPERYYTRMAWVFDESTQTCQKELVGLVGLHIVQKTPTRPQWIWSSFEQIDNMQQQGSQSPFAFHDATPTVMPPDNPIPFPPPSSAPTPFNIDRLFQINPSTQNTNSQYQAALKSQGNSVWQFYQLVMTQWPTSPSNASLDGSPANTFPGVGPTSSFSNTTMETFDQKRIQTGCMNCHNFTRTNSDFLWSLKVNAFPSILTQTNMMLAQFHNGKKQKANPITDPSILKLKKLLQDNKN